MLVDKPSPPQGPLKVLETSPTSIKVQWKVPKDDGGRPISHYALETREVGSDRWRRYSGHVTSVSLTPSTNIMFLRRNKDYYVRVMAVNSEGESEPLATDSPHTTKYPFGKS